MTEQPISLDDARDSIGLTDDQGPVLLDDFLRTYDAEIESVASREVGSRHYLDPDDTAQAIRESVLDEWKHFKGRTLKEVRAMFKRRARQYIAKEVTDYMHFTNSYVYTPAQIRHHLETTTWSDVDDAPDLDARADMLAAWQRLSPATRQAVYKRYGLGHYSSELTDAERKAANRGVDEIAAHMNRHLPLATSTQELNV